MIASLRSWIGYFMKAKVSVDRYLRSIQLEARARQRRLQAFEEFAPTSTSSKPTWSEVVESERQLIGRCRLLRLRATTAGIEKHRAILESVETLHRESAMRTIILQSLMSAAFGETPPGSTQGQSKSMSASEPCTEAQTPFDPTFTSSFEEPSSSPHWRDEL